MRTVAWLKAELAKFPDDAVCYAYEGEVRGIVVLRPPVHPGDGTLAFRQGVIYCSEDDEYDQRHETELLPDAE